MDFKLGPGPFPPIESLDSQTNQEAVGEILRFSASISMRRHCSAVMRTFFCSVTVMGDFLIR